MDNIQMNTGRIIILITFLITLSFQGCQKNFDFRSGSPSLSKSGINGEPYTGKPDIYVFKSPQQQCSEVGANGQPLPNAQIFFFASGYAQLVRENCTDIPPRPLSPEEFTRNASGEIVYQNQTFTPIAQQGDFDVVAASCPAGTAPIAGASRQSLLKGSLDLLSPAWQSVDGFRTNLVGSLASLPAYRLEVLDPAITQGWNGLSQTQVLSTQETYVFSFFVKPDATQRVTYNAFFWNNHDLQIEFELNTGGATVQKSDGVSNVSTFARAFAGGLYINVYYQLLVGSSSNMGVKVANPVAGSAVTATAFQLEKLSDFCSP